MKFIVHNVLWFSKFRAKWSYLVIWKENECYQGMGSYKMLHCLLLFP